jgi:hypothetical protein
MDIGKYIGKFLLKNKYCSLPGLGVFDLKKIGSQVQSGEVSAPKYQITFNPVGSIDDTFASFIANFENVSISNASNNIKEYCVMVKEEVAKTGRYEIENLGKLSLANNKLVFQQSSDLDLGYEPVAVAPLEMKPAATNEPGITRKDDYSYPPSKPYKNANTNWMKMLLPALILATLSVLGYFGYQYFQSSKGDEPIHESEEQAKVDTVQHATPLLNDTVVSAQDTTHIDSSAIATKPVDTNATVTNVVPPSKPVNNGTVYQVAILSFDNEASAIKKSDKLKSYGNNTSVVTRDGKYIVVNSAAQPMNDTTRLVDSLRRMFNPKGPVYILK